MTAGNGDPAAAHRLDTSAALPLRNLGMTSLKVTRIGLGMAALGRPGYINLGHAADLGAHRDAAALTAHATCVLDAAWAAGIRYFDVARSYGRGEAFLAAWLSNRAIRQNDVTVGSKWGYTYTAAWRVDAPVHEVKEHSLPVLQRQWRESHMLLGRWLRLYQIHSATLDSGVLDNAGVVSELGRLKAQGMLIGLSLSGDRQAETLERAAAIRIDGVRLFDCVQATWNLLEPSAGEALASAHSEGFGVIVKEALANGRLAGRDDDPAFAPSAALLQEQARRLGTTVDALALAAVLAEPWADVVLSGAATPRQLRANAGALAVAWDDAAGEALSALAEPPAVYWRRRGALPWN